MPGRKPLTDKQKRFVQEYLVDLNASAAYKRAGYRAKGGSADTAASRLLRNVQVQAAIQEALNKRANRLEITADRVLKELARIAFADARQVMSWGPAGVKLKESGELSDDDAAIIESISVTTSEFGGTEKVKLHPKQPALKLLAEHLGLSKPKADPVVEPETADGDLIEPDLTAADLAEARRFGAVGTPDQGVPADNRAK